MMVGMIGPAEGGGGRSGSSDDNDDAPLVKYIG